MIYVFNAALVCIWLAISGVMYAWLWHAWLRRMTLPWRTVLNLLASALLSPGVVTGHGVAPAPGGLATLATAGHDSSLRIFNFSMWLLTFLFFLVLDRRLQRKKIRPREVSY
ncbi:MAG TPA: hypothetical protein DDX04_14390 [Massilia sp.]|nr:hypothetical protein [Massilia sp.]